MRCLSVLTMIVTEDLHLVLGPPSRSTAAARAATVARVTRAGPGAAPALAARSARKFLLAACSFTVREEERPILETSGADGME